jgi:hypothetical protein
MTTASLRRWIGYDWFKLVVAIILVLLLLIFWLNGAPAAVLPAAPAPAVPTAIAAPVAQAPAVPTAVAAQVPAKPAPAAIAAPILTSPSGGTLTPGALTFTGTAAPGAMVQVLVDGQPIGTATADSAGAWSLSATLDRPGDHTVVVQTLDSAGAVAAAAEPVTIALLAPPPQISAPTLQLPSGDLTAGTVSLSGTGMPNSQVEIVVNGQSLGKAAVGSDGAWSLPASIAAGEYTISVRAVDAAGAVAAETSPARLSVSEAVAAAPPAGGAAPAIGFPTDGAQIPRGPFTMTGTGAPGSQLEILDSDKQIGSVTVAGDGSWSLPVTPSDGTAAYSARPAGSADVTITPIRVTIGAGVVAACDSLAVGCDAWVTRQGGLVLRLRSGAGTRQAVVARLPVGTQLKLLEGSQAADGFNWWRVSTLGGSVGWVAGEELRARPD